VTTPVKVGLFRTPNHEYYWNGEGPLPGVTGVIATLDKSGPLVGWAKRITAEFVVDNLEWVTATAKLVGRQPTVDAIKSKAQSEKDAGASLGSKIHWLIEDVGRGKNPELRPEHRPYVDAYRRWLTEDGFELVSLEKAVINLSVGYGGTFDILAKRDGELWLIDAKTNKGSTYKGIYTGVYPETALQMAAYSRGEFIAQPGDPKRYRMPTVDRFAVLHLRPDAPYEKGFRLIPYDVTDAEFEAFCALLTAYRWVKERSGVVVGDPAVGLKEAA
jgi:hypothetical protein